MTTREITDQSVWDQFVTGSGDYTFLQSFAWGEFQRLDGEKIWRLGFFEGKKLIGACLAFTVTARRGKFLFVPHGPIVQSITAARLKFIIQKLQQVATDEKCSFIRISPWLEATKEHAALFNSLGFRPAPTYMHSEETWVLDIAKPEEQLLAEMRKTTRNLIHRGEREQIQISQVGAANSQKEREAAIARLFDLQLATVRRHGFVPFSRETLQRELATLGQNDQAKIFLGGVGKEITSAALIVFYGAVAFYFQSGSVPTEAPVSYLLQWAVIREAKRRGIKSYNFWGVAPENQPRHPWAGLTTFKTGFGGRRQNYLHAQDLVLTPSYWLNYLVEKLPRRARLLLGGRSHGA